MVLVIFVNTAVEAEVTPMAIPSMEPPERMALEESRFVALRLVPVAFVN